MQTSLIGGSWLDFQVNNRLVTIKLLRQILEDECVNTKQNDKTIPNDLKLEMDEILSDEKLYIKKEIPNNITALHGDEVEDARASYVIVGKPNARKRPVKSIDACFPLDNKIFLTECKYCVVPTTSMLCDSSSFQRKIGKKFQNAIRFYPQYLSKPLADEYLVLVNHEHKDMLISMFMRLKKESDKKKSKFDKYVILDTKEFKEKYLQSPALTHNQTSSKRSR